jgi:hypothetical protein
MLLSISQIAELTAFDRRTVTKSLRDLRSTDGERGALLYESTEAFPALFKTDSLEAARAKQANSQASLNAVREEDLRRQRIPIEVVRDVMDEVFQALGATLKAAKGKQLTPELINQLFDKFRAAPAKLKW